MKLLKEFKAFAMRGNVIDMAVGIIIGVAFGKIVTSLVDDIIMPPIGMLVGGVDFSDLKMVLKQKTAEHAAVSVNYGNFLQVVFDFLIVAFAVFLVVKAANAAKHKEEKKEAPAMTTEEKLLTEIRDLLRK